ncbi:MAG: hypothetical protein K2N58_11785, partial [Treponemataceae bacterium]|nr:hypothetical protein [Treponemataceae bacterium]
FAFFSFYTSGWMRSTFFVALDIIICRAPSKPPTFPSTAWGCRPKTLHFCCWHAFIVTIDKLVDFL